MRLRRLLFQSAYALALLVAHAPATFAQPSPLAEANRLLDASNYAEAEAALRGVTGPNDAQAKLLLARLTLEQGRLEESEKWGQAAIAAGQKISGTIAKARALRARGKVTEAIRLLDAIQPDTSTAIRPGRLLLGELYLDTGRRKDAEDALMKIVDDYNSDAINSADPQGLALVARAAHFLRAPKNANQAFKEAELAEKKANRKNPERMLWFAELFLEKYDPGHAEELVKEALAIGPKNADALVLLARIKLNQSYDFDAADKLVQEALAVHPRHTGALAVRAGLALRDMEIGRAEAALAEGFKTNANDLELWALKATSRFLADDLPGYQEAKREAFARNPEYSGFFQIVGEYAEWEHRYDDMVRMMAEATKVDPEDGRAWAALGLWQMRSGDEKNGLKALQKSWTKDAFNVRAFNTLNLYEKTLPAEYDLAESGLFRVRYPKEEKAILERYVPRMLGEAWASMKARYRFVPKQPVQVELYSSREQFSVRTSGLPNIGIQGVCFGGVVAAMSPKSEPFNWGNVLWHELGHVFAIQISHNHVPRWFTEGLSEYETIARRPEWRRELDPELYLAITSGRLPGATEMNRAFTHAANTEDVTVAYYAASQMLLFTVERFGMPKVDEALTRWGAGETTAEVIRHAFGLAAADYDREFRSWELGRLARNSRQFLFDERPKPLAETKAALERGPKTARAQTDHALALLAERKLDAAKEALGEALHTEPNFASAHYLLARLAKEPTEKEHHLSAMLRAGADGYSIRMLLAELAERKKDAKGLRANLEAATALDPTQAEPLRQLYDLARAEKREADELPILRALAPLDQHDARVWRRLVDKLVSAKAWREAKAAGESAIFVDVRTAATHLNYGKALLALGEKTHAIFEFETALLATPSKREASSAHHWLSVLSTESSLAARHRAESRQLDPDNPELSHAAP